MNKFLEMGEPSLGSDIDVGLVETFCENLSSHMAKNNFSANDMVSKFEEKFKEIFDERNFSLVTNATTALELSLYIIKQECSYVNVVTQAIGFFGVHSMIISRGYPLSLCDTEKTNFEFDMDDLERILLQGANVIVITHMNGIPNNSEKISELVSAISFKMGRKIWIIDDLSRSLGANIKGKNLSFYSDFSIYSFQSKKHMTLLGEGGGIVCSNYKHENLIKSARGFGDKTSYGFNHKISFSQVLFGLHFLDKVVSQIEKRILIGKKRDLNFSEFPMFDFLYPFTTDTRCTYYLYTLRINDEFEQSLRDIIMEKLNLKGIGCCIANKPTYQTSSFIYSQLNNPMCPNAEYLSKRIFSISIHPSFTNHEEEYIYDCLTKVAHEYK